MDHRPQTACQVPRIPLRRRDFLRVGCLGTFGVGFGLSRFLELRSLASGVTHGKAEACILLWLEGGPSQVDTWDPKPNSSFKAISSNVPGIQISELLPRCAQHMDKLSIIRSMFSEENNHGFGTYYALTGHRPNPAMSFPGLGSVILKELGPRNEVPAHVLAPGWVGSNQYHDYFRGAFLGAEYDPMILPDPGEGDYRLPDLALPKSISSGRLLHRKSMLRVVDNYYRRHVERAEFAAMDKFVHQANEMILSPAVKRAFDLSQEPDTMREAYGSHPFGKSVLMARRLIEAGSRFVTAAGYYDNAWDAHQRNDLLHKEELVPPLDRALSALLVDLKNRGLLESTLVIVMGEFGRTPFHNGSGGRDHWPGCWSLALAGGGIRGGQVVGESDERAAVVKDRRVTIGDLMATIYKALGIDWHKEYPTPVGRPAKIANSIDGETGIPIDELV